jgi:hypothetical protein
MSFFAYAYQQMSPSFFCGVCFRPEKDLPNNCPKCDLTHTFEHYKQEASKDVEDLGGFLPDWPLDRLLALNGLVSGILNRNAGQIDKEWTVTFVGLAEAVLQARSQHERHLNYAVQQKLKALSSKSSSR